MDEYAPLENCSDDVKHVLFRQELRGRAKVTLSHESRDARDFKSTLNVLSGVLTSPAIGSLNRIDLTFTAHENEPGSTIIIRDLNNDRIYYTDTPPVYLLLAFNFTFRAIFTGTNWLVMSSPDQHREGRGPSN